MAVSIIVGDALSKLKTLPSESVHCCISSPPYYGLRDYGVEGQLGLEPSPEAYIERMVEVFREVRRVLRNDGTLWLNIGDSYCSGTRSAYGEDRKSTSRGGEFRRGNPDKNQGNSNRDGVTAPNCKPKDLLGIPWMLAFALRADGWYLRRDIIWHKPNPMPESVTDRPTTAHEYLFLLAKSGRYYYDGQAINEPAGCVGDERHLRTDRTKDGARPDGGSRFRTGKPQAATRNKRSVWTIASAPFRGAHFATFPPNLIEPCILAGTSERGVCPKCGAQWERVIESNPSLNARNERIADYDVPGLAKGTSADRVRRLDGKNYKHVRRSTGDWRPTCSCNAGAVPATVLDPFLGAGTTALVADQLGRDCIGIELNPEYAEMAERRIAGKRLKAAA